MNADVPNVPRRKVGRPPTLKDPRAHILAVSAKFFSEKGFEGSSLNKLAAGMNMSKAFIYHYFSTKEQLIEEITLDTQKRLVERTLARLRETTSHVEKVRLFMVEHAAFLDENFHEMRTANSSYAGNMSDEVASRARQNNRDHLRIIQDVFRAGAQAGELVSPDPDLSGRVVFSLLHALARWYRPGSETPAVAYANGYFNILARGMLPRNAQADDSAAGRKASR